jgi:hypothetical protein
LYEYFVRTFINGWNTLKIELAAALNDNSKIGILLANLPYPVATDPVILTFF